MASNLYCSRRDVNRWLPAGELTGSSRLAASAIASTDVITLDGHGLETDDEVIVRAAEGGTLPAPLVEGTTYYAIRVSNAQFKLAAATGGAAIDFTADGAEVVVVREPSYDDTIEAYSRWADTFLPAHAVPLSTPLGPEFALVRLLVARLSAKALLNADGKSSQIVADAEAAAQKQLERFAAGLTVRGANDTRTNLAMKTTAVSAGDARGWGSDTLP